MGDELCAWQSRAEFSAHQRTRTSNSAHTTRTPVQSVAKGRAHLDVARVYGERAGMMRVFRNWLRAVGHAGLVGLWDSLAYAHSAPFRFEMKNRSTSAGGGASTLAHWFTCGCCMWAGLAAVVTMADSGSGGGGPRVASGASRSFGRSA